MHNVTQKQQNCKRIFPEFEKYFYYFVIFKFLIAILFLRGNIICFLLIFKSQNKKPHQIVGLERKTSVKLFILNYSLRNQPSAPPSLAEAETSSTYFAYSSPSIVLGGRTP